MSQYSWTGGLLAGLLVASTVVRAQDPGPFIDPDAGRILMSAARLLKDQDAYSVHATASYDVVLTSGAKVEHLREVDVLVRRPDRFYAEYWDDTGKYRKVYYNGRQMTIHDIFRAVYAQIDVPDSIDGALDTALDDYGLDAPLADFLSNAVDASFREGVKLGVYVGETVIDETSVHHLYFSHTNVDFQVWIEQGGTPLIRKLVITYKNDPSAPKYSAVFSDWDFLPPVDESDFEFPDANAAEKIEILKTSSK
jgi:hypothetical protein